MLISSVTIAVLICLSYGRSETYKAFEGFLARDEAGPTTYRIVKVRTLTECIHVCKLDTTCRYVNFNETSFDCGLISDDNYTRHDLPPSSIVTTGTSRNIFVEINELRQEGLPRDCEDVGIAAQGIHRIKPIGVAESFHVQCDNGWTLIQKRFDGSVDFNRLWHDYKIGFGNLNGEFWLGLENIHLLTNQSSYTIIIELDLYNGTHIVQDTYSGFYVDDETNWYQLTASGGSDDVDQFAQVSGMYFTTRDQDHDENSNSNCAAVDDKSGGWWYKNCAALNMNSPMPTSATSCVGGRADIRKCMKIRINSEHAPVVSSVMKIKRN